ncbi:hypothetical protein [Zeaxanthinibacter enoshimensis]|uniref:Uncharacterized protein n=1 Tax=Zeaxanthinibacter enoshimensis TaxID=392009 RepID=A0A4R6TMU3_9FLAO|nr:hypothetical protein [Zeaxanthinibacter enoshimensis]TDQ32545.1 hypothetical protein CLV82_0374 [Zeaxanthinibacter enoshimensis]
MPKILLIFLCLLSLLSCREGEETTLPQREEFTVFSADSLPRVIPVNKEVEGILLNWPEFRELENAFQRVYQAENREDLALNIDELIEKQTALEGADYPPKFDTPKIKSRQKVLKTYILKVKGALIYRQDLVEPTVDMLEAYNAMRSQFEVIVNNKLENELILDE